MMAPEQTFEIASYRVGYLQWLSELKTRFCRVQLKALLPVNFPV